MGILLSHKAAKQQGDGAMEQWRSRPREHKGKRVMQQNSTIEQRVMEQKSDGAMDYPSSRVIEQPGCAIE